jgi:hypothetical protein
MRGKMPKATAALDSRRAGKLLDESMRTRELGRYNGTSEG